MAEIQLGTGHIFALSGATLACSALASYVSPNVQNADISHPRSAIEIKSQAGAVTGLVFPDDDSLEIDFTIIPEGSNKANAKLSAEIPAQGTPFGASGFPLIRMGKFNDNTDGALNVAVGGSSPWIYLGGASWTGPFDGVWGLKLPLKRFKNIASGSAIS
jgi:hypothetical protein